MSDYTQQLFNQPAVKRGFWARQFSNDVTSGQTIFDVIVGVVAPVLCYIYDPIVFNDDLGGPPFIPQLAALKLFVYIFSALSIITHSLWLVLRRRSGALNAIIAGILFSGAFFSLAIGLFILPLTLLGLMLLIGILGFTPFVVAFVYLRNGVRAFNAAKPLLGHASLTALFLLGAVLVSVPSLVAHSQLNRMVNESMDDLLSGDTQAVESATERLRHFGWATDLDQVVLVYSRETDQTRKDALAKAYREIKGKDIRSRMTMLLD